MYGLEWNVWVEDVNGRAIEPYNIFRHRRFAEDCAAAFREFFDEHSLHQLHKRIDRILQYWFWNKCEWEISVSGWPQSPQIDSMKASVYDQVSLNFERFFDYLCDNSDAFFSSSETVEKN